MKIEVLSSNDVSRTFDYTRRGLIGFKWLHMEAEVQTQTFWLCLHLGSLRSILNGYWIPICTSQKFPCLENLYQISIICWQNSPNWRELRTVFFMCCLMSIHLKMWLANLYAIDWPVNIQRTFYHTTQFVVCISKLN